MKNLGEIYNEELRDQLETIEYWQQSREFAEKEIQKNMQRAERTRAKLTEYYKEKS